MGNYKLYHTFAESFCQPAITKLHTAFPLPVCFLSHFSFALFHCLHFYFSLHSPLNYRPQRVDQHPAEACCQRDGGEAHFADQQPREDDSQRDVARRTEERDGHLPDAVKIASECVAGEAERVEKRRELQIVARILKRRAAARPEHKADRRARANVHEMSDIASPIANIRKRLLRNDSFTRSSFPAPRFCATSTEVAALPLSPNELAKPSMRVVAV